VALADLYGADLSYAYPFLGVEDEPTPEQWFMYLQSRFTSVDRNQYCDRRDRPTQGTRSTVTRDQWLDTLWSYYEGDPPLPQISLEYAELFREVLRRARCNYAPMIVGPMVDRMELQAVATARDDDTNGDDIAAEIMEETGFDAMFKDLLGFVFGMAEGYGMVVPGAADGPTLTVAEVDGTPIPMLHAIDPRRCYGEPDPDNPTRLRAALVYSCDPLTRARIAHMFLPGLKYEARQKYGSLAWNFVNLDQPEAVPDLNELGGIPIVRFDNFHHLGEYEPHIDLLDRLIDITLRRDVGMWYQALRTRAVMVDEEEDDYDEANSIVADPANPPKTKTDWKELNLQAGPGALLKFPRETELWESAQSDFGSFINGKIADVQELAKVTSTPVYLFTPNEAQASALSAGLQREAATSKIKDRRARLTPRLRLLWRMAFTMIGQADRARRLKFHWGPIEFVTLIESAEASNQATGTLSTEDRLERCWQMTPDERGRNMQRLTAEQLVAQVTAAPAAPQTAPQAATPPAAGGSNQPRPRGRPTPGPQAPAREAAATP
jgi:hypothetical protein